MIGCRSAFKNVSLLALSFLYLFSADGVSAATDPFTPTKSAQVVSTGDASPVKFTLGLGAGYLTGEATELVYWPEYGNHKASELTWNIDNLFLIGVNAEIEIQSWIKVKLDTWFKATNGEGSMDDYDWQVVGGVWTDWSQHDDTDVTDAFILDLSGEIAFYKTESAVFSAIVGFKTDNFGWESRGGDYTYSVGGFRDVNGSFADGELAIGYEQTYSSFYFGLGTELNFSNFKTEARIIYAPFVYGEATDNHYMRNLVTVDTFDDFGDGDLIALDIAGTYSFTDHFSLGLGFRYQSYSTMTGDSEWRLGNGAVFVTKDGAGMDQTSTMFTLILKYTF